ncbi:hypothetical protein LOY67_03990 [Pseudomonas sp. B21-056]|jgi:hypothetical protein|uniref:hypothetical protein n=1 Tax=Pseudomonas sp. B21-056 TaxID=2895495 RepID=UPI0022323CD5|nr:hypothetical protein [Pseudomonas sp. B21-056]UZE24581.1 hypothetical protein LOY67_03990 [Pseudomonas sp. B21-056]
MNRFLRVLLLLKVLVMLSLGSSAVWAECVDHGQHASSGQVVQGGMMVAASETQPGDQDNDDSTIDEPDDGDESDEGDSQT